MKRLIAVLLIFVFSCSLVGCKKEENKVSEDDFSNDLTYYLSLGQIKEADFALGTTPEAIENAELESSEAVTGIGNHDHEHGITKEEGRVSYHYIYGPFHYYYNKGKEENGISFIASFDTAYGFSAGSTNKFEIENALKSLKFTSKIADEDDMFFMMFLLDDCEMLIYESGKYQLTFYFNSDDVLVCTTLQNKELWSVKGW